MPRQSSQACQWMLLVVGLAVSGWLCGCGTTKQNVATEQLLMSDAVDHAVAKIDFTPLAGHEVFFDTRYMQNYKTSGVVNVDYVISSLRQQMVAAGVLLQDRAEAADFIIEGRLGTLGSDSHDVVYGIPASNATSVAASAAASASGLPPLAGIPELSLARRNEQQSAAKIGLFAYERASRERVWQSGISVARATAKDMWFFGIGPFQRGSIYDGNVRFAGSALNSKDTEDWEGINGMVASYEKERIFKHPSKVAESKLTRSEPVPLREIERVKREEAAD